jgi:hypothetical protein
MVRSPHALRELVNTGVHVYVVVGRPLMPWQQRCRISVQHVERHCQVPLSGVSIPCNSTVVGRVVKEHGCRNRTVLWCCLLHCNTFCTC